MQGYYPPALENLIGLLTRLPGIGQKSATRITLFLMRDKTSLALDTARALSEIKEKIRFCSVCFNFTETDPCPICSSPARADGTVCVVEGPGDQLAIEEAGFFKGRYHVLHGVLSPLDDVGPEDLKIGELIARIETEQVSEVILATNPTAEGEATASFIAKTITSRHPALKVSRIALGIPMGGDIKHTDRMTIGHSFRSRVRIGEA
ncbi:MAG: recombination protein RecR [Deltaproteobacteria bacterium CG_4_9_14_3_um_filter_51_14]|nr:MAG: recombination protein RecR [Deltaproteobacteria bacterium CG_4_9_14_3_um_filter_51_14]